MSLSCKFKINLSIWIAKPCNFSHHNPLFRIILASSSNNNYLSHAPNDRVVTLSPTESIAVRNTFIWEYVPGNWVVAEGVDVARCNRYWAEGFGAPVFGPGVNWLAVGDVGGGKASVGNGDCRADAGVPGEGIDRCCCCCCNCCCAMTCCCGLTWFTGLNNLGVLP